MKNKSTSILSFILIIAICVSAFTLPINAVEPRWTNTSLVQVALGFSDGKAQCGVVISANTGGHFDNGTITLYKFTTSGYVPVRIWSNLSDNDDVFVWTNNWVSVVKDTTYKLAVDIDVIRNGVTENIKSYKVNMYTGG